MAFQTNPKPEPWKRVQARRKRQVQQARKTCRTARYLADGGCCVRCGKALKLHPRDAGADWFNVAHIHEKRPRSLGGSATDLANTETLCAGCHAEAHGR